VSIDLDARRAQRAEATGEPTKVVLGGEHFLFPVVTEWPVEIIDVLSRGELLAGLRLLLDAEDYERFVAQKPTMGDLTALFEELAKTAGVGNLGN
jgi:hypothetical protein